MWTLLTERIIIVMAFAYRLERGWKITEIISSTVDVFPYCHPQLVAAASAASAVEAEPMGRKLKRKTPGPIIVVQDLKISS